ncbi:tyrosine-type recombinase/integrase [Micromonospora sp. LZ34]
MEVTGEPVSLHAALGGLFNAAAWRVVHESLQRLGVQLVFGPAEVRRVGADHRSADALPCRSPRAQGQAGGRAQSDGRAVAGLLRRVRSHDLRHSCATLLYEQGVPIEKIQDVLGHSAPTIGELIYVEVTRQAQRSTTTDQLGLSVRCLT